MPRDGGAVLKAAALDVALRLANETVRSVPDATVRRLFETVANDAIASIRQRLQWRGQTMPADLELFYIIVLERPDANAVRALVKALGANPAVETAYPQPIPRGAADIAPTTTFDLRPLQRYMNPAPLGIDVPFARRFAGGRCEGVLIIDIEGGWNWDHEDLPDPGEIFSGSGWNVGDKEHGIAVGGILWGLENGFGVTGIVPRSRPGWSSVAGATFPNVIYAPASAILNAVDNLGEGDIILIEQQMPDITTGVACYPGCNLDQCGYLPMEFYADTFLAISIATALGITVVEAGGNGSMALDGYSEFNRALRDSGAVIVGASGGGGSLAPTCWTNTGARVDVHSWGGLVSTLGYGETASMTSGAVPGTPLRANGNDARQWYTEGFEGTSSASPIVAGAAALVQAIRRGDGLQPLPPRELRALLVATGTPQAAGKKIGPQPNLKAAIQTFIPDRARFVSQSPVPTPMQPGQSFAVAVNFLDTGSRDWTGGHTIGIRTSGNMVWPSVPVPVGSSLAPIKPGDTAMITFSLIAPSSPGTYQLSLALDAPVPGGATSQLAIGPLLTVVVSSPSGQFQNASIQIDSYPGSLPAGQTGRVTVTATNTGNVPWATAGYGLQIARVLRMGLPQNSVGLPNQVNPGQGVTLSFDVVCTAQGTGGFSVQMADSTGRFGASPGATVVCQP